MQPKEKIERIEVLNLPYRRKADWKKSLSSLIARITPGYIDVDTKDWILSFREIKNLAVLLSKEGLKINTIKSEELETIISASALGYRTQLLIKAKEEEQHRAIESTQNKSKATETNRSNKLLFHQGTLRSGEHLETEGDVLLLGDVNPGAKISAGGDVMIWGRLLGTAHAGKEGNISSKVMALELRPLQLRIGNEIARGPQEKPEVGLAEEACLQSGNIIIRPVRSNPNKHNK